MPAQHACLSVFGTANLQGKGCAASRRFYVIRPWLLSEKGQMTEDTGATACKQEYVFLLSSTTPCPGQEGSISKLGPFVMTVLETLT